MVGWNQKIKEDYASFCDFMIYFHAGIILRTLLAYFLNLNQGKKSWLERKELFHPESLLTCEYKTNAKFLVAVDPWQLVGLNEDNTFPFKRQLWDTLQI